MNSKTLPIAAMVLVTVSSLFGGYYQSRPAKASGAAESVIPDDLKQSFEEALEVTQEEYAGTLDLEMLGKNSIQGMLHQLDPHSNFFTQKEFIKIQSEQQSRIYGIGVTIAKRGDRFYILSANPGSPGQRAGLRYGDAIVAVDGKAVEDWKQEEVLDHVRGEKGEAVDLTVERAGVAVPITVHLKRDEVKLPTVRTVFMTAQPGTGYIGLTGGFAAKTEEELLTAIARLKQEGMQQLVLDLRGNPGGLLDQAIDVAKIFLPAGQKILEVRGREGRFPNRIFEVPSNNVPETLPLVILINGQTASASEVVAGALQDHDRALIVGETSFGKGLVQSVQRLSYGAGLTLTTQRYYTPTGRLIQRDYSHISYYDYYMNRKGAATEGTATAPNNALYTDSGRSVYGGGGITPDVEVKPMEARSFVANSLRGRVFFGAFEFVRQLVAGQIPALRDYKINDTQYKNRLTQEDINRFPVDDKVLTAFRQYIAANKPLYALSDEQFSAHKNYVILQIRRELMSAAYGPEAGDQINLAEDPQLHKALEKLPEARLMADNVRRAALDK
ncbi:MAG: S41 family peptidase [Acidobacteria bacterium]|nr:S41 family peptidase [Acidobacteriota bacterium]